MQWTLEFSLKFFREINVIYKKEMIWSTSDLYNQFLNWNFITKLIKKETTIKKKKNRMSETFYSFSVERNSTSFSHDTRSSLDTGPYLIRMYVPPAEQLCYFSQQLIGSQGTQLTTSLLHSQDWKLSFFFPALNASFFSLESQAPSSEK